ncbi:hypothetical protein K6W76_09680 [Burkholderia anthina]|uniref:head-tail joining protein n=1 Tax=Burkholderia anthina TaxID=179879 RepID=UPI001589521E|nr:hypothetical protein [Burkholderia anthina]MBY4866777.1 hypothetical protein [Burkholderia anthina]
MFDPGVIWDAIADTGMLKEARLASDLTRGVLVGFSSPDALDLGMQVTVAEYQIEYRAQDIPDLKRSDELSIEGVQYRVRRPPRRKDDGYFMLADLEEIT